MRFCLPVMEKLRETATQLMMENKKSADQDQSMLDFYREFPERVTFDWPTKNAGEFLKVPGCTMNGGRATTS
jgi:hypothetical protein